MAVGVSDGRAPTFCVWRWLPVMLLFMLLDAGMAERLVRATIASLPDDDPVVVALVMGQVAVTRTLRPWRRAGRRHWWRADAASVLHVLGSV